MIIENVGNVLYNKTVSIKIGDSLKDVDVFLEVGKSQKYNLYAPNGEYLIEISGEEGSLLNGNAILTGKSIDVRKASEGMGQFTRYSIAWIFLILVLGFFAITIFKKNYKRSEKLKIKRKKREEKKERIPEEKEIKNNSKKSIINSSKIAELSLSIKGDMQAVSVVGLKIKNVTEIQSNKEAYEETMKKMTLASEERKAYLYKNQDYIFFIFAPVITKTFKNEKSAVLLSQEIEKIFVEHNKKFNKKIDFGIAVNNGEIIAKISEGKLKFMSMKTLIPGTKKIAGEAKEDVLLSKTFNDKLDSSVKTEKFNEHYKVKEIIDRENNKAFLSSFLKRMEQNKKDN
jgi:hypothetical protein